MVYDTLPSPLGDIIVAAEQDHITALHLPTDRYFGQIPANWEYTASSPVLLQARREFSEYFAGKRKEFSVKVKAGGTAFQQEVWSALRRVPYGQTTTYKDIAVAMNKPHAALAVGTAVGRNPICIFMPCHRVVATNGSLSGYVAGLERKRALLELEAAHADK